MFALPRDGIVKPRFGNVRGDGPRGVGPVPSRHAWIESRPLREGPPARRGSPGQAPRGAGGVRHVARARLRGAQRRRPPGEDGRVQATARQRREPRGHPLRGVRSGARGAQARVRPAALRRAADGRDRAPRGRHRRDEDRRGEDLRRERAALPQRAHGRERPPGDRQRLPRQARRRVEPARLRPARGHGFRDREHDAVRAPQGGLRGRHHLRHELRVRLRLPPRQHGRLARGHGAARPHLRDRRRGRLDPDRRGADAADHLGRARDRGEDVLRLRARRPRSSRARRSPAR